MTDIPHKSIAAQTYNACWELLERPRSGAEDIALLGLAYTSRYHWLAVGGPQEWAISDWMVSRVCAALGHTALALAHANAAHNHDQHGFPAWLLASLHEGTARAYHAAGDTARCDAAIAAARVWLAKESDAADAAYIQQQLDEVVALRRTSIDSPYTQD
jgi:hypothetical protein